MELIDANPSYANIRYPDGRESTVSLGDLAPCSPVQENIKASPDFTKHSGTSENVEDVIVPVQDEHLENIIKPVQGGGVLDTSTVYITADHSVVHEVRRSSRQHKAPDKYMDFVK